MHRPSNCWTLLTASMDMQTMSRITCSYFISSTPLGMLPQVAGMPNSTGMPPAAQMPCFTASAICRRWAVPGEPSKKELATPMWGLVRMSLSP